MKASNLLQVFGLQGEVRARNYWVQKAAAAPVGSQRGKLLLIVLAILADDHGRIFAETNAIATAAELSQVEYWIFVEVLKKKGFLRWNAGCWCLIF